MSCLVDTDYLQITARVRSLERSLLSGAQREHMIEARSDEEAVKVLVECGYGEISPSKPGDLDRALTEGHARMLQALEAAAPDRKVTDVFRLRYDYHNLKTIIKSNAISQSPEPFMAVCGRVKPKLLIDMLRRNDLKGLPPAMREAAEEAQGIIAKSGDPQRSDMILDIAYFREMRELALLSGSGFLQGYVKLTIDIANMRTIVRASRIGHGADFIQTALIKGGSLEINTLISITVTGAPLYEYFTDPIIEAAAAAGTHVIRGEIQLSEFEKPAANALIKYLKSSKYIAFGEQPLVAYIAAKEAELVSIRIIMAGRRAGLSHDEIRERLREAYV